jgi:hypothetical protein
VKRRYWAPHWFRDKVDVFWIVGYVLLCFWLLLEIVQ